jgi:hypothetical protein
MTNSAVADDFAGRRRHRGRRHRVDRRSPAIHIARGRLEGFGKQLLILGVIL